MKTLIGNIFDSRCECLVNTVNCVGVMGKGVALEFKKRYPGNYKDYVSRCAKKELRPGQPYFYRDNGRLILNFPTKDHWRMPSKLRDVEEGLDWFLAHYREYGVESVAFPPLGCGNGGLSWEEVGPLMYRKLKGLPIEVEAYAPYGTPLSELREGFLARSDAPKRSVGETPSRIRPSWYLILEAIAELNRRPYALNVGRVIYQKICYIMTAQGLDTGFTFKKGSYGPFSIEAKEALRSLSNANLLSERPFGDMIRVEVSGDFRFDEGKFTQKEIDILRRTVDLFSRVHSSAQAEMVATVVYAFNALAGKGEAPDDQNVFDYVANWKKGWESERRKELLSTIYYLEGAGFISISVPEDSKLIKEIDFI